MELAWKVSMTVIVLALVTLAIAFAVTVNIGVLSIFGAIFAALFFSYLFIIWMSE